MSEIPEGLEEVDSNFRNNAIQLYSNTERYIILKGKYRGSFIDTIPRGYLRAILKKWDLTEEERTIINICSTHAQPE